MSPTPLEVIVANLLQRHGMKAVLTALIGFVAGRGGYSDVLATDLKAALDRYEQRYSQEVLLEAIEAVRTALSDALRAHEADDIEGVRRGLREAREETAKLATLLPPSPPVM